MNFIRSNNPNAFEKFAGQSAKATGSTTAFCIALAAIVIWGCTGPLYNFSETWQLIINTGTTIVTFLMVFLIQKAQNKDSLAIQLKLNELVASHEFASNRLVDIEDMTEEEMETIKKYYKHLSKIAQLRDESLQCSHSIEEAEELQDYKIKKKKSRDVA